MRLFPRRRRRSQALVRISNPNKYARRKGSLRAEIQALQEDLPDSLTAAGEKVTLTITPDSVAAATYFRVYRGTTAANAKFIGAQKNF